MGSAHFIAYVGLVLILARGRMAICDADHRFEEGDRGNICAGMTVLDAEAVRGET
jgi:hypothetical protein